jgi:DNA-binding MarR family transcriptional regulator
MRRLCVQRKSSGIRNKQSGPEKFDDSTVHWTSVSLKLFLKWKYSEGKLITRGILRNVALKSAPSTRQIAEFTGHLATLTDRLQPKRRPQDQDAPECSISELRVLTLLGQRREVVMADLASTLGMPLSSATRTVDKLILKGLVERRRLDHDRRVVQVSFSPLGKEINRFVVASQRKTARGLLKPLSLGDRETFLRLLAIVAK